MVYQDQIEANLLQLFAHPRNSEWFYICLLLFLRSTLLLNRNKHIGNYFFVFVVSIALNSYCFPGPSAVTTSLWMTYSSFFQPGFRQNRPKLPGTKFATTVLRGISNKTLGSSHLRRVRAGLKPIQRHWAPRCGGWSFLSDTPHAREL